VLKIATTNIGAKEMAGFVSKALNVKMVVDIGRLEIK